MLNRSNFLTNRGISYPFSLSGRLVQSSGLEYFKQAIISRLDIAFFELLMKPEGGRLRDLLFEPLDRATADLVRIYISDALKEVPEIRVSSIQTRIDDSGDTPTIVALVCFSIYQTDVTGSVSYVVGGSNG